MKTKILSKKNSKCVRKVGPFIIPFSIVAMIAVITFVVPNVFVQRMANGVFTGYAVIKTVSEGESFKNIELFELNISKVAYNNACRSGLHPIQIANFIEGHGCLFSMGSTSVCTKCGDSICGVGENQCNCKEDCTR